MIIPIITAAIVLGKGFDYNSMTDRNRYIYDTNSIAENIVVIDRTITQSQYRLMEYSSEANDFLDIDGELSLKVKKGQISLEGYGSYLQNKIDREKTVEILFTVYHELLTETFPSYTELRTDWQQLPASEIGSHYIRSITYGGQLIISYLLKSNSSEYMQEIKAAVTANLAISGSLDSTLKGNIDKMVKAIGDKASYEIKAFATAGAIPPPKNLEDVFNLVEKYPELVSNLNNGKGSPLKFEIVSLNTLDPNQKEYRKNLAMDAMLNEATNKYDDIRSSENLFKLWEKRTGILNDKQQDMVDSYNENITLASREFRSAITSLRGDGDLDQFDKAFKAYGEGPDNVPNRFSRDLIRLQHAVEGKDYIWFPYTKAISHYIHWGGLNCSLPSPEPVYVGLAATSPVGFGSGGSLECLSVGSPELEEKKLTDGTFVSEINGMTYKLLDHSKGPLLCAFCRLENATSIITIPGRTSCPEENKLEYSGYLMTSRDSGTGSEFVCLDSKPDTEIKNVVIKDDVNSGSLEPVWMECGDCDEDEKQKYVSCVVCSR